MSLKPRLVNFDETWQKLTPTINSVVRSKPVQKSTWNETFTDVYAMCVAYPEPLTKELYSAIKSFLESHVTALCQRISLVENYLLTQYYQCWVEYSTGARHLDLLFGYLNQQHVKNSKQSAAALDYEYSFEMKDPILEVGELALDTWHSIMIEKVGERLVDCLLNLIDNDRANQPVNKAVAKECINSFVAVKRYCKKQPLTLYEELFEKKYLARAKEYYCRKASEFMETENCSLYMEKVLQLLSEEEIRSSRFLNPSSYPKVTKVCRERMVEEPMQFLNSNARDMIRNNRTLDMQHLFIILRHIPDGLTHTCNELQLHIEETGMLMVKNLKEGSSLAANFIDCILEVHNKFTELISECFQNDKLFTRSLQKACGTIVNYKEKKTPCRSPELVSRYCDSLLRKGTKGLTESDIDDKLQQCITVFVYIEEKDLFQRFYSRNLAKRLIHGLSSSMYMEEMMINRLKNVCGYDFTSKLHRMYTDIKVSIDHNSEFTEFLKKDKTEININFHVNVLQAGAWPLNANQTSFHLPEELTKSVTMFEKFYGQKFSGRKLTWLHHLAQAEVRVQITSKTYFVTMSTYQLAVLLLFNDSPTLNFNFISTSTSLSEKELEKTISLLVDAKLLFELPIAEADKTYSVNDKFVNKRTRFKVAVAIQRDAVQEVQSTHVAIAEDRKIYLLAAIVRIMKARKVLRHNELIQEVITMSRSRFAPSVSAIKRSIEALIEKGYIERAQGGPDEYRYLA